MAIVASDAPFVVRSKYGERGFYNEARRDRYVRWLSFRISCEENSPFARSWYAFPLLKMKWWLHGRLC